MIVAPRVLVQEERNITIDLSCQTQPDYPKGTVKAKSGVAAGSDGDHGLPGLQGFRGGSALFIVNSLVGGERLSYVSGGGEGGPGQDGMILYV